MQFCILSFVQVLLDCLLNEVLSERLKGHNLSYVTLEFLLTLKIGIFLELNERKKGMCQISEFSLFRINFKSPTP